MRSVTGTVRCTISTASGNNRLKKPVLWAKVSAKGFRSGSALRPFKKGGSWATEPYKDPALESASTAARPVIPAKAGPFKKGVMWAAEPLAVSEAFSRILSSRRRTESDPFGIPSPIEPGS